LQAVAAIGRRIAFRDLATPETWLRLIQRVREAEGRALRIRWGVPYTDGPPSAFLGRKKVGVVLPIHDGSWMWINQFSDQNGITDTLEAARVALEADLMEALGQD
jgi:hypothetical protein